jgi:N-acetylornithine carbamoyltransferase
MSATTSPSATQPAASNLIRLGDLSMARIDDLIDLSVRLKRRGTTDRLQGKTVGLLFFRGSLRTRASFEAAAYQLGGNTIHLSASSDFWALEAGQGKVMDGRAPEHVRDAAKVLSCYVNALAIRPGAAGASWSVDRQDADIRAWAECADVPVMNMESTLWHPLQALADLMTLRETLGELKKKKLAVCWTHSPTPATPAVVHSLVHVALRAGLDVSVAHPSGYELDGEVLAEATALAEESGAHFESGLELDAAARDAHVVYARSWASIADYGNATLGASRRSRTQGWKVDEALMATGADARLMHAMPVRRNLEVSDEVLDGPRSLVYAQAENRLHSQKALLLSTLG